MSNNSNTKWLILNRKLKSEKFEEAETIIKLNTLIIQICYH